MGTFAQGDVNIHFEKEEDAKKVHAMLKENPEASINKFLNEEHHPTSYNFYGFDDEVDCSIYFEYSSGRVNNAEWQIDQLVKFLKALVSAGEIDGVEEFQTSLMIDSGCGVYLEGDDFNEE